MLIAIDPNLSAAEAADVHARVFAKLRRAARVQVAEDLGDGLADAEFLGEADIARDALVRSVGGGRIEVDGALFAQLDDDEGLIVVHADDDDVNPPPDRSTHALASADTYLPDEQAQVAADEARLEEAKAAAAQVDQDQADALAANDAADRPNRAAAAKKAPARKAAKKAPAKKAPAKKSPARTTKKAAG